MEFFTSEVEIVECFKENCAETDANISVHKINPKAAVYDEIDKLRKHVLAKHVHQQNHGFSLFINRLRALIVVLI
jgi:hypothetical protein